MPESDKEDLFEDNKTLDDQQKYSNNKVYGSITPNSMELPDNRNKSSLLTKQLVILSFFSIIGGFLFGYDTGIVSGSMLQLKEEFHLNYVWQELIISITVATAAIFAVIAGPISDKLGRKPMILAASSFYVIGAALMALCNDEILLIIGRAVVGIGIGVSSMVIPVYIAESSPKQYRGALTAAFNMFIAFGQMIAAIVAALFFPMGNNSWRYMLGLASLPGVIQFVGVFFMPESPRYLVSKGNESGAKSVLLRLRPSWFPVHQELEAIRDGYIRAMKSSESEGSAALKFCKMLQHGTTRRELLIGGGLQMFQQLIGINTVLYYMATIVQMGGVKDPLTAVWVAAGIASVNCVMAALGTYLVERMGRRKLTFASLLGVMISLIILAIGFQVISATSPAVDVHVKPPVNYSSSICSSQTECNDCILHQDCGFCYLTPLSINKLTENGSCLQTLVGYGEKSLYGPCDGQTNVTTEYNWAYSFCPSNYSWIAIIGLLAYVVTYAPGMGPIPWTVNAEIYPTWARSTGVAFSTGVNWTFNLFISMTFLSLTVVITRAGTFWLYAGIAFLGLIYFYKFQPETKGKMLEEMEVLFSRPWRCCGGPP